MSTSALKYSKYALYYSITVDQSALLGSLITCRLSAKRESEEDNFKLWKNYEKFTLTKY